MVAPSHAPSQAAQSDAREEMVKVMAEEGTLVAQLQRNALTLISGALCSLCWVSGMILLVVELCVV
jgi:hypothetical protein